MWKAAHDLAYYFMIESKISRHFEYIHLFFNMVILKSIVGTGMALYFFLTASSLSVIAMVNYFFSHFVFSVYFLKGIFCIYCLTFFQYWFIIKNLVHFVMWVACLEALARGLGLICFGLVYTSLVRVYTRVFLSFGAFVHWTFLISNPNDFPRVLITCNRTKMQMTIN